MNICTIIAKNYVAHARVLATSFKAKHPEGRCSVLVVDDHDGYLDPAKEPFELIGIDEIGLPDAERMAASYDVTELSTAVKPWLLRTLLQRDDVDTITYLDPDILVADSIESIAELAAAHQIVLTPHFTVPLPRDGLKPSEEDILIAGTYNLGFVSLAAGRTAEELLGWWSERLERDCVIDPANGLFVDQRWIDLVPGFWPDICILRDPNFNIAYWNLPTRELEIDGERYRVNGQPLRFFHFSGFDPLHPQSLSKHQDRIDVAASPALSRICAEYAELLMQNGYEEARAWSYGWDSLPNGIRLDRPARRLYRQAIESGELKGSIFERSGAKRFLTYLREVPGDGGVNRYGRAYRDARADLREAFPDIDGRDAPAFNRWLLQSAASAGIAPELLPEAGPDSEVAGPARNTSPQRGRTGVNLTGYLSSELGLGEAARQLEKALEARQLATAAIDVPVEESQFPQAFGELSEDDHPFDSNLICVNADMLPSVARAAPGLFEGRHSAGLWFWEVERFPQKWLGSFDHLDEVWTASEFIAEALRPLATIPVNTIRVPVTPVEPADLDASALGMPEGFCFLFVFDFRSVLRRKNPLGAVEAFRQAFEPGEGASLLIKTVGGESHPDDAAALAAAAADHPDIHLLDGVIPAAEKNALIANCDCYLSLHRSEGLGLTMAEAMYFGKPVIATGYSGNLDFMAEDNSYLVDYDLARIGDGAGPYPPSANWAEPRVEHAVELMRAVFENQDEAAQRGARAAEAIRASHSLEAAGEVLEQLLPEARRQRAVERLKVPTGVPAVAGPQPSLELALPHGDPESGSARLHHLLAFEEPPARPGRLRRFLKPLYMRLLRPYAAHQRRIDLSIRDTTDQLAAEMGALERRLNASSEASTDALGERVDDLDQRLRGLDGDVRGAYAAQADELTEMGEKLAGMAEGLAEVVASVRQLEPLKSELAQMLEPLKSELAERLEPLESELAQLRETVQRTTSTTEETLARDRTFVDALRSRIDELASEIEGRSEAALSQLQPASQSTPADDIKPYMADDRFAEHEVPTLGTVIGFQAQSGNGANPGYRGFEDLFRGPETMIRERQRVYVPLAADAAPVLDLGCGRGEFLDLLGEAGVEARGVDLDPGMVARCQEKGHAVEQGDLLEVLEATPPDSLGCAFSAQVIEHLEADQLERLFELAAERLRPGGRLIVETVNPHCSAALKAFWVDPTHRQPLFPETILALCQLAGFSSASAFCPLGEGDWEKDRLVAGEYAVVATA